MTMDGYTYYARQAGSDWHIVSDRRRLVNQDRIALGVCGQLIRVDAATEAVRETGDAPACPDCLRYFYRQDGKR